MKRKNILGFFITLVLCISILMPAGRAVAQTAYPTKPIDLIVPFGPGGGNDQWARILSSPAEDTLGALMRVRNVPGAGGVKGCRLALKSKPDGYTLLCIGIEALLTRLILQKDEVGFTLDDIQGVVTYTSYVPALAVNPKAPFNTAKELFNYAQKNPGKFTFGTSGPSSVFTYVGALVGETAGITFQNVPFDGTGEAITAALGGHTMGIIASQDQLLDLHKSGKLRVLFTTGEKRTKELSDVPTLKEVGYDLEFENHRAVYAPKGISKEKLAILDKGFAKLIKHKGFTRLAKYLGEDVIYKNSEETTALLKRQYGLLQRAINKIKAGN